MIRLTPQEHDVRNALSDHGHDIDRSMISSVVDVLAAIGWEPGPFVPDAPFRQALLERGWPPSSIASSFGEPITLAPVALNQDEANDTETFGAA